jgi:polysaccharide biosynthesis protein PslH
MKITFLVSGSVRSNFTYRVLKLASSLQQRGHDVMIVAPSVDKYNNFTREKITNLEGVTICQPFQFNTKNQVINLIPYIIGAAFAVLKRKSNLIYIYKPTPISVVGLVGKFFKGTPVLLDMDDLGSEVMKIEGHPRYQQVLVAWSERIAAKWADKIVVASSFLKDFFRKQFPEKPIHIMPNGVDDEWFIPVKKQEAERRIVFLGAINRKNILEPLFDVLPAVVKEHPSVHVLIMGDGQYLTYFKEKARNLELEQYVTFTGWMNLQDAKNNLLAGDIGYNYMPHERTVLAASNMKIPQYMSRGVIPFVSDIGDLPAAVDFGKAGYIAISENLEDLKQQLMFALKDDMSDEKSRYAQVFSKKQSDWSILTDGFESFLGISKRTIGKKKVYVVSTTNLSNSGGAEIRNFNLVKQLSKSSALDISVFCIGTGNIDSVKEELEMQLPVRAYVVPKKKGTLFIALRSIIFKRVFPFLEEHRMSGLGNVFRNVCESSLPDVVHIEHLIGYYCVEPHLQWLKSRGVKIIFDAHNVESHLLESSLIILPLFKRIAGQLFLSAYTRYEINAIKSSDLVTACSDADADFFRTFNKNVFVIPNGVDSVMFIPSKTQEKNTLLFMGGVAYPPNGDALSFYLKEIHPLVKDMFPQIKLVAIGATSQWAKKINLTDDPSVTLLGFVEDIRPYLAVANIGICPVRYGSGTRLKILTYMSAGLPIVSTTKGAEGIKYEENTNIMLADTAADFARKIVDILRDPVQYETMALRNRELATDQYDWNVIGARLLAIYDKYENE